MQINLFKTLIYLTLISLGLLIEKPQVKTFSLNNIGVAQETDRSSEYIFYAEGELDENSGKDSDNRYYDFYTFDAQKGEQATINLISDDFDAYFNLVDADGNLLSEPVKKYKGGGNAIGSSNSWTKEYRNYVVAYRAATEIVNCYDGE